MHASCTRSALWLRRRVSHGSTRWKVRLFPEQALPSLQRSPLTTSYSLLQFRNAQAFVGTLEKVLEARPVRAHAPGGGSQPDPSRAPSCRSFDFIKELALPCSQENILSSFYRNPRKAFSGTRVLLISQQSCSHSWFHSLDLAGLHSEKCDF